MKRRTKLAAALCGLGLMMTLALPAFAAGTITTETTMGEIRSDPRVQASGIWTYQKANDDPEPKAAETTLRDYVGESMADDCAKMINALLDRYEAGGQVTYKVYTEEEIAAQPTRNDVELYYLPAETPGGKYVIVMSGNVLNKTSNLSEGYATAWQLHERGYAVFVLRYRVFQEAKDNAPVDDLGRAVQYITAHAETFGAQPEDYALLGYSSGGHLAGIFGSEAHGYRNYGVPRPGALILGYPINDFFEYKPIYHLAMDPHTLQSRYYEWTISGCITDDYPPVFHWYGMDDYVFPLLWYPAQRPALNKALQAHHIPYEERLYKRATHGVGTGTNTDAEGWLDAAVAFWETQTAE